MKRYRLHVSKVVAESVDIEVPDELDPASVPVEELFRYVSARANRIEVDVPHSYHRTGLTLAEDQDELVLCRNCERAIYQPYAEESPEFWAECEAEDWDDAKRCPDSLSGEHLPMDAEQRAEHEAMVARNAASTAEVRAMIAENVAVNGNAGLAVLRALDGRSVALPPDRIAAIAGLQLLEVLQVLPALELAGRLEWSGTGWRRADAKG